MHEIPTYWWSAKRNFGDRMAPLLLEYFAGIEGYWAPLEKAALVCTGSVLDQIPKEWDGVVIGAGKLHNRPISLDNASILAIRGPLSARGLKGDFALGDPGLLANELVNIDTKRYDLGIVPHWSDKELASNPTFAPYDPLIIDPRGDVLSILSMIGQCKKIVSSSLHGIILADAFGIPRRFEYTDQFDKEGGLFKFRDYSASINTKLEIGVTTLGNRFMIENRKNELNDAFRLLASLVA